MPEIPHHSWELKLGILEKQLVLLTFESFHQTQPPCCFYLFVLTECLTGTHISQIRLVYQLRSFRDMGVLTLHVINYKCICLYFIVIDNAFLIYRLQVLRAVLQCCCSKHFIAWGVSPVQFVLFLTSNKTFLLKHMILCLSLKC